MKGIKILLRRFVKKRFSLVEKPSYEVDISKTLKDVVEIVSTKETLAAIQKSIQDEEKGAYLRFGDGDVFLLSGKNDVLQKAHPHLQMEMIEAFKAKGAGIYKSLSLNSKMFGYENGMFDGNHLLTDSYAMSLLLKAYVYFVGQKIYSPVALHFMAVSQPRVANKFLHTLKSKAGLLIANETTKEETVNLLFGNVPFVKTPSSNSYLDIDGIYNEAKNELKQFTEFRVVVVAMGCSGRILMNRFLKEKFNVFFFDFGSLLDGFDGKFTRQWLTFQEVDYQTLKKGL